MIKLVWDTSALLNIKEDSGGGYSPGYSLMKDFRDGWIKGPYLNIFPAIAFFEVQASISRMEREGRKMLREFYIIDEHSMVYPTDHAFIKRSDEVVRLPGFNELRGADLVFACIAYLEDAWLVTLDGHFERVKEHINVLDLNESRYSARYRRLFE